MVVAADGAKTKREEREDQGLRWGFTRKEANMKLFTKAAMGALALASVAFAAEPANAAVSFGFGVGPGYYGGYYGSPYYYGGYRPAYRPYYRPYRYGYRRYYGPRYRYRYRPYRGYYGY
jgi:hypothetical protein